MLPISVCGLVVLSGSRSILLTTYVAHIIVAVLSRNGCYTLQVFLRHDCADWATQLHCSVFWHAIHLVPSLPKPNDTSDVRANSKSHCHLDLFGPLIQHRKAAVMQRTLYCFAFCLPACLRLVFNGDQVLGRRIRRLDCQTARV